MLGPKFRPNEPKCLTCSGGKASKLSLKLVFCDFLKVALLVFFDIAQDCSLGQCLTSSRAKTSKKNLWPK